MKDKIIDAIENVDPELVEAVDELRTAPRKKAAFSWIKGLSAVAAVLCVIGLVWFVRPMLKGPEPAVTPVVTLTSTPIPTATPTEVVVDPTETMELDIMYYVRDGKEYEIGGSQMDRVTYPDVKEREEIADLVVVGTFVGTDTYVYNSRPWDYPQVEAMNTLRIDKVFKGDAEVGDEITVFQGYAFVEESGLLYSRSGLIPMEEGDTWIFFLRRTRSEALEESGYACVGDSDGRYPYRALEEEKVWNHEYTSEELGMLDVRYFSWYYYRDVIAYYGIAFE